MAAPLAKAIALVATVLLGAKAGAEEVRKGQKSLSIDAQGESAQQSPDQLLISLPSRLKRRVEQARVAQNAGTTGTSANGAGTSANRAGTSANGAGTSANGAGTSAKGAGTSANGDDLKRRCRIYTYWNQRNSEAPEIPLFHQVAVESFRRHTSSYCKEPILITDDNVKKYIPDLPQEFFSLPYPAAKADFIRYAVIYHLGGIFFDIDMLMVKDMTEEQDKEFDTFDLIAFVEENKYGNRTGKPWLEKKSKGAGECQGFSSALVGGKKHSRFFRAVWEAQKKLVTRHCEDDDECTDKVCCFNPSLKKQCHVPWQGLGETLAQKIYLKEDPKQKFLQHCFTGQQSYWPNGFSNVIGEGISLEDAKKEFKRRKTSDPLERQAYHFFNALHDYVNRSCDELFNPDTVAGHLFIEAFTSGLGTAPREGKDAARFKKDHPEFSKFAAVSATRITSVGDACSALENPTSFLEDRGSKHHPGMEKNGAPAAMQDTSFAQWWRGGY